MASDDKLKRPLKGENAVETRQSPPKAIVDCSPLQPAISKNKEALKIKLMVRRPIAQLVDQGIIPSLKSSPALHEQRKQLERAKTGDILKAKIQQRPDRQELERRHILEHDESHVDPSLAERQRMLKKARLADQLNSQLSHRPGPLELIKKNILHTEEPIERIVKEGLISFKATSEGLLNRPQQPNGYITYEDDSLSSEGDVQNSPAGQDSIEILPPTATAATPEIHDFFIPLTTNDPSGTVYTTVVSQSRLPPPAYYTAIEPIVKPIVKQETSNLFAELCQSVIDNSGSSNVASNKPVSRLGSLLPLTKSAYPLPTPVQNSNKTDAPGKDKNRKKNKLKPMAKTRTIKFHEYKGPPNAHKNGSTSMTNEETSYQLLLKQQNCLLEYLEGLHKSPPSNSQSSSKSMLNENQSSFSVTNSFKQQSSPLASNATTIKPSSPVSISADIHNLEMSKLEKMKVSDLKLLLKTRNLPVSGPKPQLIERLRPFVQSDANVETMTTSTNSSENIADDDNENLSNNSPSHMETDTMELHETLNSRTNVALLREQQRKIDELQRKLKESQQELQQMQMKQSQAPVVKMITNEIVQPKSEVLNQKQIFKQQLEAKIQKDKLQKLQLEQQDIQRRKQENSIKANETFVPKPTSNFIAQPAKNPNEFVWNGESTILLVNFPDDKKYVLSKNPQTATMQNILVPISTTAQNINAIIKKMPPPSTNLHLTQIASPKIVSSHSINVIDNQQTNSTVTLENACVSARDMHQQPPAQSQPKSQSQSLSQSQHQQTLPSISNVMLNNVTTSLPFTSPSLIKKEYSLFDPTLASNSNTNNFNMIPNNLLLNPTEMDTMSPMQQSNCDDSCNSFDLFLSETAQSHSGPTKMNEQYSTKELNAMNETIKKEPCQMSQQMAVSNDDHCPVDLKAFDDLELMELAHQLDMDISDDSCQPIKQELHSHSNGSNSQNQTIMSSCRRELNPSLQPSLQKLVFDQHQQQQQQQQQQQHQFINNHQQSIGLRLSNKDNKLDASMGLYGNNDTNNNNNDNSSNNLDSIPNNNLMDYNNQFYLGNQNIPITPSALHLGSMDIEYFDNTLAQFDFQLPPTTTATPNSNSNQTQSSNAMHFDPIDQQWNCDALLQQLWN